MTTDVSSMIDRAIEYGNNAYSWAKAEYRGAYSAASELINSGAAVKVDSVDAPVIDKPDTSSLQGADAQFDSINDSITRTIGDAYAKFLADFVSLEAALSVDANNEEQIWQRDRDRLTRQAQASMEEARAQWAASGWPVPAGALLASSERIQVERDSQIAQSSRERAIKSWELEYEAAKFLLQITSDLRIKAAQAAAEYVKAIALGPQIAAQTVQAKTQAATALVNALMGYYSASTRLYEARTNVAVQEAKFEESRNQMTLQAAEARMRARVDAALASAQGVGSMAQAALNGVNATAQAIISA
jgi:hypothetical protein